MKCLIGFVLLIVMSPAFAISWSYQVNVNGSAGQIKAIDASKSSFDAGPYYCEVTPVVTENNTEFRSLICSIGTGTVGTGGLCTSKSSKTSSVQYAILNLNGPKNIVNVVVSCKFD
jgi:hypothetical protein